MKAFKEGDICVCKAHPECFFEPGSVVVIVDAITYTHVYLAKLLFGTLKKDVNTHALIANTKDAGAVQFLKDELELFNE